MSYSELVQRLSDVRRDIRNLNRVNTTDVQEKIQILKAVNSLLREQNELLCIRQEYLNLKNIKINNLYAA